MDPQSKTRNRIFAVLFTLLSLLLLPAAAARATGNGLTNPVINEYVANHTGSDTNEYVEIKGDPDTDYSGFWILEIEGDSGASLGVIDRVFQVGTTNADGYWVTSFQSSIENGTITLLLVSGFTGSVGNDIDADDDGTIDNPLWTAIVDDVGVNDDGAGDLNYSATVLNPFYDGLAFAPGGASRIPDGTDTDTTADWVRNDFDGYGLPCCTGTPDPGDAVNTPGAVNEVVGGDTPTLVINEIDYDQVDTDDAEFIEIMNTGPLTVTLDGVTLELVNGTGGGAAVYDSISLPAVDLGPGEYFVICANAATVANCDLDDGPDTNFIQNGSPDAVALRFDGNILDTVSYEGDTGAPYTEGTGTTAADSNSVPGSISRCPDGSDTDNNDADFTFGNSTPGEPNDCGDPQSCTGTPVFIHDVQGSGASSPLVGSAVEIAGVVVGDYQSTTTGLSGFFMQEEDADADADPLTSEGIFVFDAGFGIDVSVGDLVQVGGTVVEFFDLTELGSVTCLSVLSTGNPLPTAATIVLPVDDISDFEPFEGMLVTIAQELTVTETFSLGRFGEVTLSVGGRLYNPTNVVDPGTPANDLQDLNDRSRIQLDDGSNVQNPLPLPPYLGDGNTLRSGDTLPSLTGVLGFAFGVYEIHPTGPITFTRANERTTEPDDVGGSLEIASFNVLNYFTTIDAGPDVCGPLANQECRGADSATELTRQTDKIVNALLAIDADVVGLIEIENDAADAAVAGLVAALNAVAGAGTYDYIATGPIGSDAIRVALIYKPASVTPVGAHAILDSSVDPTFLDDKNRPVLAQTFEEIASGETFTVAVNHLKSKGSSCDDVGDPDTGDGQGNCNLTRLAAAIALANWLAGDPTGSGDLDFLIIGDLNAYAMEDPIVALEDIGFIDLVEAFVGTDAYSYVFRGQSGYLDHALANPAMATQVSGATIWHINADEPISLDYNTEFNQPGLYTDEPYRSSDHDPVIVGLDLGPVAGAPDLQLTKDDGGITATYGQVVAYTLTYTNAGSVAAHGIVITETVPIGTDFYAGDSSPGWSCANGSPRGTVCSLSVGSLSTGQSGSAVFAVHVHINGALSEVENTAEIGDDGSNGPDGNPADNTAEDTTPLISPIVHIDSLEIVEIPHPDFYLVEITYRVVNQFGFAVINAIFHGDLFEHPDEKTGTYSIRTREDGEAIRLSRSRNPGVYSVCAVNVTGPGVVYDPGANEVTCGSLGVSGPVKTGWVFAGSDQIVQAGETVEFNGAYIPLNGEVEPVYIWNFGDGSSAEGTLNPSHTYETPGAYLVSLTVIDDDGPETHTITVTVLGPFQVFMPIIVNGTD
ncbi:MAG TPA: ExeM/NucH family extracellular endonuclease [Anaerolineales bacterium]|nr:ExeM/NucH family extracellular endonuclease [Anaerolineales bacterium]